MIGPMRNGGIGTANFYLARYLRHKLKYDVTILFTGWYDDLKPPGYFSFYYLKKYGIHFIYLPKKYFPKNVILGSTDVLNISYAVYQFLKKHYFDVFIFAEWMANGFYTIRAKKILSEFSDQLIITVTHSPHDWELAGLNINDFDILEKEKRSYAEKYILENTDVLVSPSKHMFKWVEERGWKLSKRKLIIPYVYHKNFAENTLYEPDRSHLIFFGRLESRKGLEIFCKAFKMSYPQNRVRKITFLGKMFIMGSTMLSIDFLVGFKQQFSDLEIIIKSNLDTEQAKQYIRDTKGLVIMPSLLDNFPYTVIECLREGFPFLASNVGGIPEMVDKRFTFEPTVEALSNIFLDLDKLAFDEQKPLFSLKAAELAWQKLLSEYKVKKIKTKERKKSTPLVSVCIPYFNDEKYLPILLDSLAQNKYSNFEVIVADENSTDIPAIKTFEQERKKYNKANWNFYRQSRQKTLKTKDARNLAALKARGEYLIFIDPNNIAEVNMIEILVNSIVHSEVDCLTCQMTAFDEKEYFLKNQFCIDHYYFPLGSCLKIGWIENIFGWTNFIVKKSIFKRLGGFEEKNYPKSYKSWEFLTKLSVQGFSLDVIPKPLYKHYSSKQGHKEFGYEKKYFDEISKVYVGDGLFSQRFADEIAYPLSQHYRRLKENKKLLLNSKIWKVTKPIRYIYGKIRYFKKLKT